MTYYTDLQRAYDAQAAQLAAAMAEIERLRAALIEAADVVAQVQGGAERTAARLECSHTKDCVHCGVALDATLLAAQVRRWRAALEGEQ